MRPQLFDCEGTGSRSFSWCGQSSASASLLRAGSFTNFSGSAIDLVEPDEDCLPAQTHLREACPRLMRQYQ